MPAITRVLSRKGRRLTFELDGGELTVTQSGKKPLVESFERPREAAERMIELSRTRLGQEWVPVEKAEQVSSFIAALEELGVRMWEWVVALSEAELAEAYRIKIEAADPRELSIDVLRRRPTRALLAFMLAHFGDYYEEDWTKAVKFLSKDPEQASWIAEELSRALADGRLPTDRARKFAERNVKKIAAGPRPEPVAPGKPAGNEGDLLQAIALAPDDDAPRLVYADWLLDQGVGWGEYVQLSCQIARAELSDPGHDELKRLEKKHAKLWLEPIRPFIRTWSFERGLLSRVTCDASLFIQAADAIALRAPRAYLELTGLKKRDVRELSRTPLGRFATINLSSQRIDDAGMAQLAASPTIAGVTDWELGYNGFSDAGLKAIAASAHFGSTVELSLQSFHPTYTGEGLAALLSSRHLGRLRQLQVAAVSVAGAFESLAVELETLGLSVVSFTDADAEALAAAASLAGLVSLSINQAGNEPLALSHDAINLLLRTFKRLRWFTTNVPLSPAMKARIEGLASRA